LQEAAILSVCLQDGRPSLRPGAPGSEEPTQAYPEVRRGVRRSDNEGYTLEGKPIMEVCMSREEQITSMRGALEWLKDEVKVVKAEVDPVLEVAAINKAFDDGPAFLFENIKGYPDVRMIASLWGQRDRIAKLMGADSFNGAKFKLIDAIKNPLPAKEVKEGPCQEIVIPGEEVDPFKLFPMIQHTERDGGRFFGSGVHMITGKYCEGKSQLSFYRMSFRGKNYASINMVPGGHGERIGKKFRNEKIPCTVNICPPPMVELLGAGTLNPIAFGASVDELGIAGALQGSPIELVKAKTIDAYAIANSEWVIEGYIVPAERVWETQEAEEMGTQGKALFHPEWARYMGRAYRVQKFEVTAVTRRKDKPLFYVPIFGTVWTNVPFVSAALYEIADRLAPGFVQDVTTSQGLTPWGGTVIQVKKRRPSDEGLQRNVLATALAINRGMRLAIAVDEDVNIYEPEEILWAMTSRVNPSTDIIFGAGGRGQSYQPAERAAAQGQAVVSTFEGGIGIDATIPFAAKNDFQRARYAVDKVDFSKWFTKTEIEEMRAQQSEYIRFLGETGLV
jgi:UbiD family decarboxylase